MTADTVISASLDTPVEVQFVFHITSAGPVMTVPSQIRDPRSQLARDSTKKLASLISRSSRGLPAAVDSPQRFGAEHR